MHIGWVKFYRLKLFLLHLNTVNVTQYQFNCNIICMHLPSESGTYIAKTTRTKNNEFVDFFQISFEINIKFDAPPNKIYHLWYHQKERVRENKTIRNIWNIYLYKSTQFNAKCHSFHYEIIILAISHKFKWWLLSLPLSLLSIGVVHFPE